MQKYKFVNEQKQKYFRCDVPAGRVRLWERKILFICGYYSCESRLLLRFFVIIYENIRQDCEQNNISLISHQHVLRTAIAF